MQEVKPGDLITADLFNGISGEIEKLSEGFGKFLTAVTIDSKGNVGIGTVPTGAEKLSVNGTVKATDFAGDGSKLTGIAAGKWSDAVSPAPAGSIYYDKGNVGIGTEAPDKLPLCIKSSDTTWGTGISLDNRQAKDGKRYGITSKGGRLTISDMDNSKDRFVIDRDGNVGIGTTAPSEKLEVNGTVKANAFVGDGSKLTGIAAGKWSEATQGSIYYDKGNVGIGTTNPSPYGTLHLKSISKPSGLIFPLIVECYNFSGTFSEIADRLANAPNGTIVFGYLKTLSGNYSYLSFAWKGNDGQIYYLDFQGSHYSPGDEV